FQEFAHFLRLRLPIDRTRLDLLVMHLARELRKFFANMFGILLHMLVQRLHQLARFLFLFGKQRDRLRGIFSGVLALRRGNRGRHDRLRHLHGIANRTGNEPALQLPLASFRILEPAFKRVALVANEAVADHEALSTRCNGVRLLGAESSKRRPCCSEGMRERALAPSVGSISAIITPGSVPPSATTFPHGSTTMLWPNVSRPFSCRPPCAAASTSLPVSIARARIKTFQCASPVIFVKAAGIARKSAPPSASAR